MKKVLIIAYLYPPAGGVGAHRITKYVKYLPGAGWRPHVLTVKERYYDLIDPSLRKDVPENINVFRTCTLNCGRLVKRFVNPPYSLDGSDQKEKENRCFDKAKPKLFRLLKLVSHHIFVPDYEIGWVPFAIIRGMKLCRKYSPDVLFVTGSPYSSFLAGVILSGVFSVPLVVDLRDAWTLNVWRMREKTALKRQIERCMERKVVEKAARIVCVQKHMCEDYKRFYPSCKRKFVTITNGFDTDDFRRVRSVGHDNRFNIVYTGRFPENSSLRPVLEALKILEVTRPGLAEKVQVTFVGELGARKKQLIKKLGLEPHVSYTGYVSHEAAIAYMAGAHVLLMVGRGENDRCMLPAKVFEYLASGRPILAVMSPHCATADIVRHASAYTIVDNGEDAAEEIATALALFYQKRSDRRGISHRREIDRFSRKRLTRQLVGVFDSVCAQSQSSIV